MKTLFIIFLSVISFANIFAQNGNWDNILYSYSSGPVSPEYQYNYKISVNISGWCKLTYTKNGISKDYDFFAGLREMKKLKSELRRSKVFRVSPDEMKSENILIGGHVRNAVITLYQIPTLDQKPETITIPNQVNEKYRKGIEELYDSIEDLVPQSVWNQTE